jgi:hypothetical protein
MKSICKVCAIVVASAFSSATIAQPSPEVKDEKVQMQSDKSTLSRDEMRMKANKEKLKSDTKEGKMAADKLNPKADEKK